GLRRRVAILRHIGAVHDARHESYRRVVDAVLGDERFERAVAVPVRISRAGRIEADRTLALGVRQDLIARHVDDLGAWVDELPDEPGAGDPIGLRVLAGDPLHGALHSRPQSAAGPV